MGNAFGMFCCKIWVAWGYHARNADRSDCILGHGCAHMQRNFIDLLQIDGACLLQGASREAAGLQRAVSDVNSQVHGDLYQRAYCYVLCAVVG